MLSVIIPTLNEENYLPILLSQIKKQNFSDLEVIVADGGSTDKTLEIARKFGAKVVKGGNPAQGRNSGARVAKGEILLFLDADVLYLPENFFEKILLEFKKRKLGVATFPQYPRGNFIDKFCYKIYNNWVKFSQKFLAHGSNLIMVKKEIFERIGGFDERIKIAEDHDFCKRAAKISKFGFIETEPVLISARRFERDGRLKTYGKYFFVGIWMYLGGSLKRNFFDYKFNHYNGKIKVD